MVKYTNPDNSSDDIMYYTDTDMTIQYGSGDALPMKKEYSSKVTGLIVKALMASQDGFGVFNQHDILIFCNETLARNFGFDIDEVLGKSFEAMLRNAYASGTGVKVDDDIDSMVQRAKESRLEYGFRSFEAERVNGNCMKVSRLKTEDDYIFVYTTDITQLKQTENALRDALSSSKKLAATDSLTGISNRRHFLKAGNVEFERSKRYGMPLSVLALDIDHFKSVNDTYGHQAGDQVLKSISHCCSKLLRTSDIFGRLGGEEFSILMPNTDIESAKLAAHRLLNEVAELNVDYENQVISFTTSIGISQMSEECDHLDKLMKQADEALYTAKHNGRNRMETWS